MGRDSLPIDTASVGGKMISYVGYSLRYLKNGKWVSMQRTIIIGDVHGCIEELNLLLKKVNFSQDQDELYFTGDLINRGPDSLAVYQRFKEIKGKAVIGNHEYWALKRMSEPQVSGEKVDRLREMMGSAYSRFMADIRQWPAYIETDQFILVHAGCIPTQPLAGSDPFLLTTIRTWDGVGKDLNNDRNPPWFDLYKEEKLIVFGHWAKLEGVIRKNVIGLDTGCVYGKKLSALILPERKIVSVDAKRVYHQIRN